jgi:hypothetical protein
MKGPSATKPNPTQSNVEGKKRKGFLLERLGYTFFFLFFFHSLDSPHSIHYFKITLTHPLELTLSQTAKLSDRQIPIHELELHPQLACS